ncbi:Uncharacterised protein [Mycobacterium tuberculosis]|nr:Uncharacterised protein [Mycobacterium tuberculosis]
MLGGGRGDLARLGEVGNGGGVARGKHFWVSWYLQIGLYLQPAPLGFQAQGGDQR